MSDGEETETVEKFLLLEKLKKKRTSVRRRVTQTIKEIDEAIQCNKRQALELWVANLESLDEELKSLQDHIEEYISEEDCSTDLTRFMDYQTNMIDAQGRCRAFCQQQETTDAKQSLHDGTSGFETNSANIKLPKIPLPKFSGQSPIEWVSFWDQFTAGVDENQSLRDVQKLAYLKSCLLGPAAESILEYTLTEDNYSLVVEFLKKRFGKKRLIIQAHMDAIIDLSKFDTMEINEGRNFLDILESNLRSVVPLAPLLITLLMRKS